MSELKGNKRRLSINLSFLSSNEQPQMNTNNSNSLTTNKSKKFEGGGLVGLGLLAAINDMDPTHDPYFTAKPNKAAILAVPVSPRSTPIPIFSTSLSVVNANSGSKLGSGLDEMELSEEYTCVISHIGDNLIKKKEYFDGNLKEKTESTVRKCGGNWVSSGVFLAFSPPPMVANGGGELPAKGLFESEDFLSSCYLCKKKLQGLDIFMYRGEKAFCSTECRHKQILTDERKEKCGGSGVMKTHDYSVSPCSGPMQFLAGVAAA